MDQVYNVQDNIPITIVLDLLDKSVKIETFQSTITNSNLIPSNKSIKEICQLIIDSFYLSFKVKLTDISNEYLFLDQDQYIESYLKVKSKEKYYYIYFYILINELDYFIKKYDYS